MDFVKDEKGVDQQVEGHKLSYFEELLAIEYCPEARVRYLIPRISRHLEVSPAPRDCGESPNQPGRIHRPRARVGRPHKGCKNPLEVVLRKEGRTVISALPLSLGILGHASVVT